MRMQYRHSDVTLHMYDIFIFAISSI